MSAERLESGVWGSEGSVSFQPENLVDPEVRETIADNLRVNLDTMARLQAQGAGLEETASPIWDFARLAFKVKVKGAGDDDEAFLKEVDKIDWREKLQRSGKGRDFYDMNY